MVPSQSSQSPAASVPQNGSASAAPEGVSSAVGAPVGGSDGLDPAAIDDIFKELKTLLSTVEKLQKARQEVGDIKPLVVRLLDGELLDGDDLEQLKSGLGGLAKLVRLHGDYQSALASAQPARGLLDQVLKP